MKSICFVLCLALIFPLIAPIPAALAGTSIASQEQTAPADLSAPQKTVESFFAAFNRMDLRGMVPCVLDATTSSEIDQLQKDFARTPVPGKIVLSNFKVYKDDAGTEAVVSFQLELRSGANTPENPAEANDELMVVRKVGEEWKIVAPNPEGPDGRMMRRGLSDASNLAMLVRYPNAIRQSRNAAQGATSLSNVKQIALGLMMYTQDYDEVFVPDAARYKDAIQPYVKSNQVFTSPLDPAGTLSYRFNPQLVRKTLGQVRDPVNTVMIFEGEYKKLLFRYQGKAIIGFVDGHVKLVTPEEAAKLRWTP